jgi:hypothetical protein
MTLQEQVNKVFAVAKMQYAATDLSIGDVVALLNDSRQQVAQDIVEDVPWKFGKRTGTVGNPYTFDNTIDNFMEEFVVLSVPDSGAPFPCRKVDKEELYQFMQNSFSGPTTDSPMYYREGQTITVLPASPSIANIDILYIAAPVDLTAMDDEDETMALGAMPYETQELIITRTLVSVYEKMGMSSVMDVVLTDYGDMLKRYKDQFVDQQENLRVNLASRNSPQR